MFKLVCRNCRFPRLQPRPVNSAAPWILEEPLPAEIVLMTKRKGHVIERLSLLNKQRLAYLWAIIPIDGSFTCRRLISTWSVSRAVVAFGERCYRETLHTVHGHNDVNSGVPIRLL